MGSSLSTEAKFIQDIQTELRTCKVHITKTDLCKFFTILHQASPWFVFTAPRIANSTWATIGQDLAAYCDAHLDTPFKNYVLKYWQLLDGLITSAPSSPSCSSALKESQATLSSASRPHTPHSLTSSVSSHSPATSPPPRLLSPPPYVPRPPLHPTAPPLSPLVSLAQTSSHHQLPPSDQADLDAAAAAYQPQPAPPLIALSAVSPTASDSPSLTPSQFQSTLDKISSTLDRLMAATLPSTPSPFRTDQHIL